jgi:hypothetical protein
MGITLLLTDIILRRPRGPIIMLTRARVLVLPTLRIPPAQHMLRCQRATIKVPKRAIVLQRHLVDIIRVRSKAALGFLLVTQQPSLEQDQRSTTT